MAHNSRLCFIPRERAPPPCTYFLTMHQNVDMKNGQNPCQCCSILHPQWNKFREALQMCLDGVCNEAGCRTNLSNATIFVKILLELSLIVLGSWIWLWISLKPCFYCFLKLMTCCSQDKKSCGYTICVKTVYLQSNRSLGQELNFSDFVNVKLFRLSANFLLPDPLPTVLKKTAPHPKIGKLEKRTQSLT